ncbi:MAG TPA: histidine--tRNA ligase [Blastocatellia bacterium]|nr:histidine--tRNA ligase [Blastocatellia bacterium]
MKKIKPISGFPEWLPDQKLVEQYFIDRLREKFELFGFTPIETRSVEPLDQLLKQGETDKEIYVLRRLQAAEGEGNLNLGLHYDLTVPFTRYVAQNRGQLQFPMRRYQIQKAWRGERPQEGRYREFYQADIDIIAENDLPVYFDAEMVVLLHEVVTSLPIPRITVHINNRKVLEGFYRALGIEDVPAVLRAVDKLDKIGEQAVSQILTATVGLAPAVVEKCLDLARIRGFDASVADAIMDLGVQGDLLRAGVDELRYVMRILEPLPGGSVVADLHIARGFDYYTGTVYEGIMMGHEDLGAVCSGGRYDNLASGGSSLKLPGVGISIGLSRILGRLFSRGLLRASRSAPSSVLVALTSEETRPESNDVARALRVRKIPCEVFHTPAKYGKQVQYAEKKGIPFVWFTQGEQTGGHEVRDIRTGVQAPADVNTWTPPPDDLSIKVSFDDRGRSGE